MSSRKTLAAATALAFVPGPSLAESPALTGEDTAVRELREALAGMGGSR